MSEIKKRNTTIDFAKGATILLMLFDHIYGYGGFITSFHMPLFFIISGYFYKEEPLKDTLEKKVKKLLIPFVVIEFICIVTEIIVYAIHGATIDIILQIIREKSLGFLTAQNNHLTWFLMTLFIGYMVYAIIYKLVGKHKIIYTVSVLSITTLGYFISSVNVILPYQIDVSMVVVIYISIGHMCKKYGNRISNQWRITIFLIAAPIWGIGIDNGGLVIALRYLPYYPYCIIQSVAGVYCMMCLYEILDKIPFLNRAMRWYGRNTIVILCLGAVFRNAIGWAGDYPISNTALSYVVQLAIITVLVVLWNFIKNNIGDLNRKKVEGNGICS